MSDKFALAVGDGSRRMTYADLAAVRGISVPSARRLVLRQRWPRQIGNDGLVRVMVPLSFVALEKGCRTDDERVPIRRHTPTSAPISNAISDETSVPMVLGPIPTDVATMSATEVVVTSAGLQGAIETAISPLREQLVNANQRADRAEQRAERAERQAADLQAELVKAQVTERGAADRATAAMAEAADLRRRLELAEERAEEGRALVACELDRADQAEGRLADKDATITGLVAEKQELRREIERLTGLLAARRSWWRRVFR